MLFVAGCDGASFPLVTPARAEAPVSSVDKHEKRVSRARDAARSIGERMRDRAERRARRHFRLGMAEALGLDPSPLPTLTDLRRAAYEAGAERDADDLETLDLADEFAIPDGEF
ncbi:MAG: hypothetical protein ABEK29_02930, partial [Bradymonadaceae bacterium]